MLDNLSSLGFNTHMACHLASIAFPIDFGFASAPETACICLTGGAISAGLPGYEVVTPRFTRRLSL